MIEVMKKNEIKALEIINKNMIIFFQEESKKLKLDPNLIKFFARFCAFDTILRYEISDELGVNATNYLLDGLQLYIASFFGLDDIIQPAHKHLKNDRAFFALYSYLMYENQFPSVMAENVERCLDEYGRKQLSIEARTYAAVVADVVNISYKVFIQDLVENSPFNHVSFDLIVSEYIRLHESLVVRHVNEYFEKEMRAIKKSLNSANKLTVYRGFEISSDDDVRRGRLKINNPESHLQDAGKGMFYTTDKDIANAFAINKFSHQEDFIDFDKRTSNVNFILKNANFDLDKFMSKTNRRAYIGKYEVNFKDVLYARVHLGESEIVAIPSKVNLVNYMQV